MCSIMGYCGNVVSLSTFEKAFEKTKSRGPDDTRILAFDEGILGFHRLAIMGLNESGMQPFEFDGSYVVCNGEIYGFRKIKEQLENKGYHFVSESDCEILLPLFKELGTDMFSKLDAEFAMIIFDGRTKQFIAARDPIGIRPLYYGYDQEGMIVFASEPKNLTPFCKKILPFPPGHYYLDGKFVSYRDMTQTKKTISDDLETICSNIRMYLSKGVSKRLDADAPLGFLLSGGLDSSLVCSIATKE